MDGHPQVITYYTKHNIVGIYIKNKHSETRLWQWQSSEREQLTNKYTVYLRSETFSQPVCIIKSAYYNLSGVVFPQSN